MIIIGQNGDLTTVAYFGLRTDHPNERIIVDRYRATIYGGTTLIKDSEVNLGPLEFPRTVKVNPATGLIFQPSEEEPNAPVDYLSVYDYCKAVKISAHTTDTENTIWDVMAAMIESFMADNGFVPEVDA